MSAWKVAAVLAAAVLVAGVTGGGLLVRSWTRQPSYPAAPNIAASTIAAEELSRAADRRIYFAHMSVGRNVVSGMNDVLAANAVPMPQVIEVPTGGTAPEVPPGGAFVHGLIGDNGDPNGKLANFDAAVRSGLGDQVDIVLFKFCYLDVTADTDVEAVFANYRATADALERDYPDVTFLHSTVPLTTGPKGIKANLRSLIGRDDNRARERYNELVRAAYGPDRLFDLAAAEATAPDGTQGSALYPGYSSDGSHLNASGSAKVAVDLLRVISAVAPGGSVR